MKCERCGSENYTVKDSREIKSGVRRRRRKCLDCGAAWTTYEIGAEEYGKLSRVEEGNAGEIGGMTMPKNIVYPAEEVRKLKVELDNARILHESDQRIIQSLRHSCDRFSQENREIREAIKQIFGGNGFEMPEIADDYMEKVKIEVNDNFLMWKKELEGIFKNWILETGSEGYEK